MIKAKQLIRIIAFSLFALNANAATITFNDRTAFENYVGSYSLDDLDTDTSLSSSANLNNSDYSWTMADYACVNSSGCNYGSVNPFINGSNDWVWTYNSGTFEMNFGVTAFGLDYVNPYKSNTGQVGIHGFDSGINSNGSFFGIATDDGSTLTSISYQQYTQYQGFDNVIYSTTSNGSVNSNNVPEPASLALFSLGLVGLRVARCKA